MSALAAGLIAWAVWLLMPSPPDHRVGRLFRARPRVRGDASPPWLMPASSAALGIGIAIVTGSIVGAGVGIAVALVLPRLLGRLESRAARERRVSMARQLPEAADLLAATLSSGAPTARAVRVVAEAVGEPMGSVLSDVASALNLGATSAEAWSDADQAGEVAEISAAFIRSESSGAPLAEVLARTAHDLRRRHRVSVEVAARAAGVRAVAPLAVCFLPAFRVVGVLPVVASMAATLL